MIQRPEIRKVLITHEPTESFSSAVQNALPNANVLVTKADEIRAGIVDAQLVIGGPIDKEVLAHAERLVWQHVPWAGVESVISPALAARNVTLTNSRGVSAPNMAEHAIAMMLAFGRALPTFFREQQERSWRGWESRPAFFELTGQTVVLLGMGAIGKATAERLRPFGCTIIGARRSAVDGAVEGFDRVVSFGQLADVLPDADHVVSSLPMTRSTRTIFSADLIASMKPGSYFFNVGRGGTVDQDALIEALKSGHLAGAGLDVTDPEPLPKDSPLWEAPNTIITGHTSGSSPMVAQRVIEVIVENLRRYQAGEELINVVDLELGY